MKQQPLLADDAETPETLETRLRRLLYRFVPNAQHESAFRELKAILHEEQV